MAGEVGPSQVKAGFALPSSPPEQVPGIDAIYTYLMNAGLSPADVTSAGDEIRRRVREAVVARAMGDDPDAQRRYLTDHNYRHQVNTEIVAEVVLGMGFEAGELRMIDAGLQLGLAPRAPKGPLIARCRTFDGAHQGGTPEDFEVLERGERAVLKSLKDGRIYTF